MEYTKEQEKANQRFEQYRKIDPYPFEISKGQTTGIMPALLNWDDIQSYVNAIGMISPFDKKDLKPASYPLKLLGPCIYYDDKGEKQELVIDRDNGLMVASNSIVFLTLEPLIQLPDYIAARFNLKIDLVYKGCLLGTGPLVDPGFIGRLSFPLHNLTTNDYYLEGGSKVAMIEFTKLSPNEVFKGEGKYPDDIKNVPYKQFDFNDPKDVWDYMYIAYPELKYKGSIRSSIPDALAKGKESAKKAASSAKRISWLAVIAGVTLLIVFITFIWDVRSSIKDSEQFQYEMLEEARGQVHELRQEINNMEEEINRLEGVDHARTRRR